MTLLAMLRHGDTAWSRAGLIQGRTDTTLDAAARTHLSQHCLPERVSGLRVVSSPLLRCIETAQLLALVDVSKESRIAEMSWGEWEGQRLHDLRARLGEEMASNESRGMDFMPPGGECPRQVLQRVRPWLAELAAGDAPTLAICHRGVIRVVFASATLWDMTGRPPAKLDWTALHLFEVTMGGMVRVAQLNVPLALRDRPLVAPGAAAAGAMP